MKPKIKKLSSTIRILKMIQEAGHKDAIIAGGAIRDLYHQKPISDIDIFVQHPKYRAVPIEYLPIHPFSSTEWSLYWADVLQLDQSYSISDGVRINYSAYYQPSRSDNTVKSEDVDILAVWDISRGLYKYQVIFLSIDPIEYVNRKFDFGLCKTYCDGTCVRFTDDFLADSTNCTISLVGENLTEKQVDYAIHSHLPRIQEKYPGYRLVVPDHYNYPTEKTM